MKLKKLILVLHFWFGYSSLNNTNLIWFKERNFLGEGKNLSLKQIYQIKNPLQHWYDRTLFS